MEEDTCSISSYYSTESEVSDAFETVDEDDGDVETTLTPPRSQPATTALVRH